MCTSSNGCQRHAAPATLASMSAHAPFPIASRRCGLEARWVTSQARQADVVPSLHMVIGRRLDQSGFLLLAKATRKHISMYDSD